MSAPAPSAQADALRLVVAAVGAPSEFERWRHATRWGRRGAWALSLALMASGAASFALRAPMEVSGVLEAGGWALGAWLRRARRSRLQAVRAWGEDERGGAE